MGKVRAGYNAEQNRNKAFGESLDFHKSQEDKIIDELINNKMTAQELSDATGIRLTSVHRALRNLVIEQFVIDSEETKVNPETQKQNTLWQLTPKQLNIKFALKIASDET